MTLYFIYELLECMSELSVNFETQKLDVTLICLL